MYDLILKWKSRFLLIFNTVHLRLISYRNIKFSGVQNICHSTQIYGRRKGVVILGKRIRTDRQATLVAVGGKLLIGDYCFFNEATRVVCRDSISIGARCLFGPNVCVYDHDHIFGYDGIKDGYKTDPIIIEKNCWIGANVTILRGTHIGEGCVIGAGTVVKGEIPAHSLVKTNRTPVIEPIEPR